MLQRAYPIKPAPIALREDERAETHSLVRTAKNIFLWLKHWLNRFVEAGGPLS